MESILFFLSLFSLLNLSCSVDDKSSSAINSLTETKTALASATGSVYSEIHQTVWRGGQFYYRSVPVTNQTILWSQSSWVTNPIPAAKKLPAICAAPAICTVLSESNFSEKTKINQCLWLKKPDGLQAGYCRDIPIAASGQILWSKAEAWPTTGMQADKLPGTGLLVSQDMFRIGNKIHQSINRANGTKGSLGYIRTAPISQDSIQWQNASKWSDAIPYSNPLIASHAVAIGSILHQWVWSGSGADQVLKRTVSVRGEDPDWASRSSWSPDSEIGLPGSGTLEAISTWMPPSIQKSIIPGVTPKKYEPANGQKIYGFGQGGFFKENILPGIKGVANKVGMEPILLSYYSLASPKYPNNLDTVMKKVSEAEIAAGRNFYLLLAITFDIAEADQGKLDGIFQKWGAYFKNYQEPIFIRPLYEMGPGWGDAFDRLKGYCDKKLGINCSEADIAKIAKSIYVRCVRNMQYGASGDANKPIPYVSFVWHVIPTGDINSYRLFYPDNGFGVDWVGVSWFGRWGVDLASTINQFAEQVNKPIIIPESGPLFMDTDAKGNPLKCDLAATSGPRACGVYRTSGSTYLANTQFLEPYFNAIEKYPRIKAFVYIGDDFRMNTCTSNCEWHYSKWGDFRLQSRQPVLDYFSQRLSTKRKTYIYQP